MSESVNIQDKILENATRLIVDGLKDTFIQTVERELTEALTKALLEGEFYRRISDEMRDGLREIYKEINHASRSESAEPASNKDEADKLFHEASKQLDEILDSTENAAMDIMDIVEKHLDAQARSAELLTKLRKTRKSNDDIEELLKINAELGQDLMTVMTNLGFQDITGQRIKRIITALKKIESTVFELFVSTGLIIKAREESPDKDLDELSNETKKKVTELKGPTTDVSQNDVDDLLGQLGLE